jgi:hypothetical protein
VEIAGKFTKGKKIIFSWFDKKAETNPTILLLINCYYSINFKLLQALEYGHLSGI